MCFEVGTRHAEQTSNHNTEEKNHDNTNLAIDYVHRRRNGTGWALWFFGGDCRNPSMHIELHDVCAFLQSQDRGLRPKETECTQPPRSQPMGTSPSQCPNQVYPTMLSSALPRENHRKNQNDRHEGQKEKVNAISSVLLLPIFGRCGMLAAL